MHNSICVWQLFNGLFQKQLGIAILATLKVIIVTPSAQYAHLIIDFKMAVSLIIVSIDIFGLCVSRRS